MAGFGLPNAGGCRRFAGNIQRWSYRGHPRRRGGIRRRSAARRIAGASQPTSGRNRRRYSECGAAVQRRRAIRRSDAVDCKSARVISMKAKFNLIFSLLLLAPLFTASAQTRSVPEGRFRDWNIYGGSPENIRYSALDQINRGNVGKLAVAWTFDTGDAFADSEMQCNPIVVNGTLYATTPKIRAIALDAATGKLRWSFDPNGPGR